MNETECQHEWIWVRCGYDTKCLVCKHCRVNYYKWHAESKLHERRFILP